MSRKRRILAVALLALAAASTSGSASNFGYRGFEVPYLFGSGGGYYIGP